MNFKGAGLTSSPGIVTLLATIINTTAVLTLCPLCTRYQVVISWAAK